VKQRNTSYVSSTSTEDVIPVPMAWMLDVDGVLVSLISKRVEACLIEVLAHRLMAGELLTFNSGRSPDAIAELVLSFLEPRIPDKTLLSRIMVVGEKAGAWGWYTPDGALQVSFDPTLVVPCSLVSALRELLECAQFTDLMEIEHGKRTMISVIKRKGISLVAFQRAQTRFVPLAQACLTRLGFDTTWKIDSVSDSTEIEHKSASKGKGASRIMQWFHDEGHQPQRIIAIEDSPSGITMAEALHQAHLPVEFVFTGSVPLPERTYDFPIIRTRRTYVQGTIDYLAKYDQSSLADMHVRG
jgi:hypothetical protein